MGRVRDLSKEAKYSILKEIGFSIDTRAADMRSCAIWDLAPRRCFQRPPLMNDCLLAYPKRGVSIANATLRRTYPFRPWPYLLGIKTIKSRQYRV